MIIWRGFGILVPVIAFAALILGQSLQGGDTTENMTLDQVFLWRSLPLAIAGVAIWFLGKKFNRKTEMKLEDPETKQPVIISKGGGHSFFFIPMEFWGLILFVLAGVLPFVFLKNLAVGNRLFPLQS